MELEPWLCEKVDSREICSQLGLWFSLLLWDSKIARLELWLSKETSPSGERYPLFCKASKGAYLAYVTAASVKQSSLYHYKPNPYLIPPPNCDFTSPCKLSSSV